MLRDGDISFRASVLLLITAGSQSETRIVTFCCKKVNFDWSKSCDVRKSFFGSVSQTVFFDGAKQQAENPYA